MSWAICLITDIRGSCLIYEPFGPVPEPVLRLRQAPLGRLLAAIAEFSNGGAVSSTIASVAITAWRSPRYVVSILNSGADSVLPKMITNRLEAVPFEVDLQQHDYTVHSAVAAPSEHVETAPGLKEFAATVVRPLVATYFGRNLLDVFAIESVIQCELVDDGFPSRLLRLDEIEPRRRTAIGLHNIALWREIRAAAVGNDAIANVAVSDMITAVVCKPDLVVFTIAPIRKDLDGIRALTPDLQSAIAEWTRIQTTNPSEPGWADAPRPPVAARPSERRSRDLRQLGPDRSSAPVRRRSADAALPSWMTPPGEIDTNKGRSQS